jgi:hypothetical protein
MKQVWNSKEEYEAFKKEAQRRLEDNTKFIRGL